MTKPAPDLVEGPLVVADISGYTKFVTQTEIDHSVAIVHELLECTVAAMSGQLEVSQVEGDAVLFIGGLSEERVLEVVEHCFVSFHRRGRAMKEMTTCPCQACRHIDVLRLKFVLHRGAYSKVRVGGIEQLHGSDVIVTFRLLKNQVPGAEYVLASKAFLDRLPAALSAAFAPHQEEYDHIGTVECSYRDLGPVWEAAVASERRLVAPADAKVKGEFLLDVPLDRAWELLEDPECWRETMGVHDVTMTRGARGSLADSELHCHHGKNGKQLLVMRVVLAEQPHTLTITSEPGVVKEMWQTFHFEDAGEGRTRAFEWITWDTWPGLKGKLMERLAYGFMRKSVKDGKPRMEEMARRRTALPESKAG